MPIGKLYRFNEEQFISYINYRLFGEEPTHVWGELVPIKVISIRSGTDYIVELDDKRKFQCSLKKNVNLGVIGMPSRFRYRFMGADPPTLTPPLGSVSDNHQR